MYKIGVLIKLIGYYACYVTCLNVYWHDFVCVCLCVCVENIYIYIYVYIYIYIYIYDSLTLKADCNVYVPGLTELLLFCTRVEVKVSLFKTTWIEVKVNLLKSTWVKSETTF